MKRTKETWLHGHPDDRTGVSGLRFFDGEDLHAQERKRAMQETQRKWIEEQKRQNEERKRQEQDEERQYAHQTMQITRMRGLLEDELSQKQRMMQESTRDENLLLARQKKERENLERQLKVHEENDDLQTQGRIRQVPSYINPLS